jgi:uncharacterized protein YjbI with pentapeptide repeats
VARLFGANLSEVGLIDATLDWARLDRASLCKADLSEANLSGAILSEANLDGANLFRANLRGAALNRADLSATTSPEVKLTKQKKKRFQHAAARRSTRAGGPEEIATANASGHKIRLSRKLRL